MKDYCWIYVSSEEGMNTMSNMNMMVVINTHELNDDGSLWRNDEFKKNYLALTGRGKRYIGMKAFEGWMIKTIAMT